MKYLYIIWKKQGEYIILKLGMRSLECHNKSLEKLLNVMHTIYSKVLVFIIAVALQSVDSLNCVLLRHCMV
jgi:hypothetical protein